MGDVYRESRYREYDDRLSDDEPYKSTTVRRYKIKPSRDDRYEHPDVDDGRSRYSRDTRGWDDNHEYERERERRPERPRSAFEPHVGMASQYDDRRSTVLYDRDVLERDYEAQKEADRGKITVYEGKGSDFDDRRTTFTRRDDGVRVERRVEDRYDDHGYEIDHYRKETEYYTRPSPPSSPVIIRAPPREPQKIYVEEAPAPPPVVIPRQSNPGVMVVREKERDRELARRERPEEDYYYRHTRYEVGPHDRDRDRDWGMAKYDRHRRDHDYSGSDDDYYVHRRRVVRRERSESPENHKRTLAAGALAGAGITALMNSRRDEYGDVPDHRGRKVIAGSALGALGTEALRRAHSAYEDRHRDRDDSPDDHSRLKKGLGIAAVALAAAGAAKYYQSNKVDKEEASRGRSRGRRRSAGGRMYSRSRSSSSRSRGRSLSTAAKAALGTAATAGIVKHFRDKSKSRSRSRSKSKIRRAAEIGGAAAAAGVATKMWKNHKDKKERSRSSSRAYSDDDRDYVRGRGRSVDSRLSRSRSRSQASRSIRRSDTGTDPQLGLVEYGNDPLGPERGYESEAEERRRRRRRRRRRSVSSDGSSDRHRSKSRLRDMASAGAAAFGIKEYKDRKDAEKREQRDRRSRITQGDAELVTTRMAFLTTVLFGEGHRPSRQGEHTTRPTHRLLARRVDQRDIHRIQRQSRQPTSPKTIPAIRPLPLRDRPQQEALILRRDSCRQVRQPRGHHPVLLGVTTPQTISMTMERHKKEHEEHEQTAAKDALPLVIDNAEDESDSSKSIEELPDRFHRDGQPISTRSQTIPQAPLTTRSGEFERRPQRPGDWDVRGSWQVGGTDPVVVERMVRSFTDALDGKRGWMGVLGDVLESGLLPGPEGALASLSGDGGGRDNRGRHRKR
ncbi:uncharacterized protein J7T54_004587 [Emericellopsis cladophorae]|uniref:DUF3824 domain-containing protein n=1 Tax=Emericellopsis cladophorae TaxID=2686198 RepID=A0A9Q0BGJ3_9HYPO|nr:uncharacterized protein J7T54_004587 [Emericellopsis cladophorae]KAI6784041.1 hypothetical protein J7T54_004587 [Emericellopsis cladophorae]